MYIADNRHTRQGARARFIKVYLVNIIMIKNRNNPLNTGVVLLENLPEKEIFISLKKDFYKKIENKIRFYGIFKICRKLSVSNRIVCHWLNDGSLIRLDILNKILIFFNYDLKGRIYFMRGKDGFCIYNPKLPFNFTTKGGVRFIAAIFGDGCLDKKYRVFYANSNKNLLNGFLKDIKSVFGDIQYDQRKHSQHDNVDIISLSPFIGKVISLLGVERGKKVENNPKLPDFVFGLKKEVIGEFLSQIIDDEGSINLASRHITIGFALIENYKSSSLLDGVKQLLLKLGINSSIHQCGKYSSSRGENRFHWCMEIHSSIYFKKLYKLLNLRCINKKEKFRKLLDSSQREHFPTKECYNIYLTLMKNLQKSKGYFTSYNLAIITGRNIGSCRNTILKLRKKGVIKCFKSYKGSSYGFARYGVLV